MYAKKKRKAIDEGHLDGRSKSGDKREASAGDEGVLGGYYVFARMEFAELPDIAELVLL